MAVTFKCAPKKPGLKLLPDMKFTILQDGEAVNTNTQAD